PSAARVNTTFRLPGLLTLTLVILTASLVSTHGKGGTHMAALSPTIDEYLESCRAQRQAKGTVINKRVVLQQLLADIGNLQVHNIDGGHIDAWLTKRSYKAPST